MPNGLVKAKLLKKWCFYNIKVLQEQIRPHEISWARKNLDSYIVSRFKT